MKIKQNIVIVGLIAIVAMCGYVPDASATAEFTFVPPRYPDLRDLDHYRYYTWGIDVNLDPDRYPEILEATITIRNIRDWTVEDDDMLFIHLLDDVPVGFNNYHDIVPGVSDHFAGEGVLLLEWSDPGGGTSVGQDLEIVLDAGDLATLAEYSADGNFGFGFDPDCHYFNDGVEFRLVTEVVPEPATLALFGFGAAGLGVAGRFRSRRRKRS